MGVFQRGVPINLVERFYLIDPLTEEAVLANPTTVVFTLRYPDDTEVSFSWPGSPQITNPSTGIFVCALNPPLPTGVYRYDCVGAGAVQATSFGTFEVLEDGVLSPQPSPVPVPGPCNPWITGDDVADCCDAGVGSNTFLLDEVAQMASWLMFELSARLYNGVCERTVRPCRQACMCFGNSRAAGLNMYWTAAPTGAGWANECGDKCGCGTLSYVPLAGQPVREIVEVKIDGQVLDPSGYRLEEHRRVLRLSEPGPPVISHQWPACQDLTLDDTEPGTFSIRYRWGIEPPALGKMAAAQLACELWKACPGNAGECRLPNKVTRVVRQGVTMERIVPLAELLRTGATGLQIVDAFLAAANPHGIRRRSAVFSPDVNRPGRII